MSGAGRLATPLCLAILFAAMPCAVDAQTELPDLIDQRVRVALAGRSDRIVGVVTGQESGTLSLRQSGGNVRVVQADEVAGLERSLGRHGNARKGLAIGAGTGFLAGGLTGVWLADEICGSCDPSYGEAFFAVGLAGAVGGGILGLAIGAASGGESWESVPLAPRLGFGLGPGRSGPASLGLSVSLSFD